MERTFSSRGGAEKKKEEYERGTTSWKGRNDDPRVLPDPFARMMADKEEEKKLHLGGIT